MENKNVAEAYGRFSAEYMSALYEAAAKDWAVVRAYIDAEADRVAQSDPPVVDRMAVTLANETASLYHMVTGGGQAVMSDLDSDIWDTVYRFREKTCAASVSDACFKYGDDETLAAYLDGKK